VERVTGIGGVFFRARDPEALTAWYADLDAMLAQLRAAGVETDERVEELDGIGRFGWAVDPEGNRFELWEPAAS
jgi:predicted enzyme related to lactoylglutathione lyase